MKKVNPRKDRDTEELIDSILTDEKHPVREEYRHAVKSLLISAINMAVNSDIARANTVAHRRLMDTHYGISKVSKITGLIEGVTVKVNGRNRDITCPAILSLLNEAIQEIQTLPEERFHKSPAWYFRDLKRFLLKHNIYPSRNSVDKLIQRVLSRYNINADISTIQTQTKGIKY